MKFLLITLSLLLSTLSMAQTQEKPNQTLALYSTYTSPDGMGASLRYKVNSFKFELNTNFDNFNFLLYISNLRAYGYH